ncbi:unnamed protein product, partial [Durusdinium trenchii]
APPAEEDPTPSGSDHSSRYSEEEQESAARSAQYLPSHAIPAEHMEHEREREIEMRSAHAAPAEDRTPSRSDHSSRDVEEEQESAARSAEHLLSQAMGVPSWAEHMADYEGEMDIDIRTQLQQFQMQEEGIQRSAHAAPAEEDRTPSGSDHSSRDVEEEQEPASRMAELQHLRMHEEEIEGVQRPSPEAANEDLTPSGSDHSSCYSDEQPEAPRTRAQHIADYEREMGFDFDMRTAQDCAAEKERTSSEEESSRMPSRSQLVAENQLERQSRTPSSCERLSHSEESPRTARLQEPRSEAMRSQGEEEQRPEDVLSSHPSEEDEAEEQQLLGARMAPDMPTSWQREDGEDQEDHFR